MASPSDRSGTDVGPHGVRRHTGLARDLVEMLRAVVGAHPGDEAPVALGGERVT